MATFTAIAPSTGVARHCVPSMFYVQDVPRLQPSPSSGFGRAHHSEPTREKWMTAFTSGATDPEWVKIGPSQTQGSFVAGRWIGSKKSRMGAVMDHVGQTGREIKGEKQ